MEQSEKNIFYNDVRLADIGRANQEVIARGDYPLAYRNIARSLETCFDTALLRWRRGESPVADMEKALALSGDMLAAITEWQLDDETLNGYGYTWLLVRYVSFFLDQPVALPVDRMARIREDQSRHADIALDYRILDALEGREWREDLEGLFDKLASKKRQALAVDTYRVYFALLESGHGGAEADTLVLRAETNYARRARDPFYSGGPTFMGGGPDNPYVVDVTLGAVLKKIEWNGESIHRWRWG